jgi:hypothetical protein
MGFAVLDGVNPVGRAVRREIGPGMAFNCSNLPPPVESLQSPKPHSGVIRRYVIAEKNYYR